MAIAWQRRGGRKFESGTGSDVKISPGDILVSSLAISSKRVTAPYRWFYALDSNNVVSFLPPKKNILAETEPKLINLQDEFLSKKFKNRKKKADHIGAAGILVGALMAKSGQKLPYHILWCNGKHYVEYLSLGKAEGNWYKVLHNRMNKYCPLRAPLTKDMAIDIYDSKRFILKSQLDNEDITLEIDKWPDFVVKLFAQ